MGATSSRIIARKQYLRSRRSQAKNSLHQSTRPAYRISKFTELFDGPTMPDYPHSEFTEHFDIDHSFIDPATATEKARADLQKSKPKTPPEADKPKQEALSPIKELSSRPSTVMTPTSRSHSPDTTPCLSPSSVYSRATSASKPFIPLNSAEPGQSGGYFVFNGPHGGFCDTRHLFENTIVPAWILIATLAVLIEEADARDVDAVEEFRARLPRFSAWVKEKEGDDGGERLGFGDGIVGGGWEEGLEWLRSHWVYEGHKRAVVAKATRRANVAEKSVEIKGVGTPEDGTAVLEIGNENKEGFDRQCTEDDLELPQIISEAEKDDDKSEVSRGRSRTPRRATSAKRSFRVLEIW